MNDGDQQKQNFDREIYISYVSNMASYVLHRRVPVVDRCEDTVYRLGV